MSLTTVPAGASPAHLVLSAGGVRCLAYIGALDRLTRDYRFETVSACSAGTLVGALLCAGVSPATMGEEVMRRDLRELGGAVSFRPIRELSRRLRWPYALYKAPGIPKVFKEIVGRDELEMGDLCIPLSTAAIDVVSERLLVYSTGTHPSMQVTDVLEIATAVPTMYEPHPKDRDASMEVVDAAITSHTPLWLTTGFDETLPIIVLRAPARTRRPPRKHVFAWVNEVLQSGIAGQDAYALARSASVTVHDIKTDVDAFDFDLDDTEKAALIKAGFDAVAGDLELRQERARPPSSGSAPGRRRPRRPPVPLPGLDGMAQVEGVWRQRRYAAAGAPAAPATVFISYAHEDRPAVELLRPLLSGLVDDENVTVWDDAYIGPGEPWEERIADAVLRARVAVVLVSASFNASDYIRRFELPLIQRQEVEIVWVSLDGRRPDDEALDEIQGIIVEDDRRHPDVRVPALLDEAVEAVKQVFAAR